MNVVNQTQGHIFIWNNLGGKVVSMSWGSLLDLKRLCEYGILNYAVQFFFLKKKPDPICFLFILFN